MDIENFKLLSNVCKLYFSQCITLQESVVYKIICTVSTIHPTQVVEQIMLFKVWLKNI